MGTLVYATCSSALARLQLVYTTCSTDNSCGISQTADAAASDGRQGRTTTSGDHQRDASAHDAVAAIEGRSAVAARWINANGIRISAIAKGGDAAVIPKGSDAANTTAHSKSWRLCKSAGCAESWPSADLTARCQWTRKRRI